MAFCIYCGAKLDGAEKFCPNCGKQIAQSHQSNLENATKDILSRIGFIKKSYGPRAGRVRALATYEEEKAIEWRDFERSQNAQVKRCQTKKRRCISHALKRAANDKLFAAPSSPCV